MDYQESLKLCTERHGVKPIASMDLQQKLQRAANEHAKGGPAGVSYFAFLASVSVVTKQAVPSLFSFFF